MKNSTYICTKAIVDVTDVVAVCAAAAAGRTHETIEAGDPDPVMMAPRGLMCRLWVKDMRG